MLASERLLLESRKYAKHNDTLVAGGIAHNVVVKQGTPFVIKKTAKTSKVNLLEEAMTLKCLSFESPPIHGVIVRYEDYFESATHRYLVMESFTDTVSLKDFVLECHALIRDNELTIRTYRKTIVALMWQLLATLDWLHRRVRCCHLAVFENVRLTNSAIIRNESGSIDLNPQIGLKLVNFSHAKWCVQRDDKAKSSANFKTDMLAFGMTMSFALLGRPLYVGHLAVRRGQLKRYLGMEDLLRFVSPKLISLLNALLVTDERKRYDAMQAMHHKVFGSFV